MQALFGVGTLDKLQVSVISSMGNPFMDLAFSFNLTFADIMLKCDVSKKVF